MKTILLALLVLAPTMAHADTKGDLAKIDAAENACESSPDGSSTVGMDACINTAYVAADKVLNVVYKQITVALKKPSGDADQDRNNATSLKALINSEKAWVAYRDSDSYLLSTEMIGGTGQGTMNVEALYSLTKGRAIELDDYLNDKN
jgi:uncharacterized protein YecT (DUF1311 family)